MRKTLKVASMVLFCIWMASMISCSVEPTLPPELKLKYECETFEVYYPTGWTRMDGVGGGVILNNADGTVSIPINIIPFPESRKNDVGSINELTSVLVKNQKEGAGFEIISFSGYTTVWLEASLLGDKYVGFIVPFDGAVLTCLPDVLRVANTLVTIDDVKAMRAIVENIKLK